MVALETTTLRTLAAGVVVPLPLLPGERPAAAVTCAGPVFDCWFFGGGVVGVEERVGLFADPDEVGGGDVVVLEEAACPGVAAFAVGAEHLRVGVGAVALEVAVDRLGGDRVV